MVNKVKLIKRMLFGRANLPLLRKLSFMRYKDTSAQHSQTQYDLITKIVPEPSMVKRNMTDHLNCARTINYER